MTQSHFADISAAIRGRLDDNWTTTPILYENLDEAVIQTDGETPQAFIALETMFFLNDQMDIGDPGRRLFRTRGMIKIYILTPVSAGDGLGLQYADALAEIYRGQRFDGVVCYGASIRGAGEQADDAGKYWRITLGIEFYADKVFTIA